MFLTIKPYIYLNCVLMLLELELFDKKKKNCVLKFKLHALAKLNYLKWNFFFYIETVLRLK